MIIIETFVVVAMVVFVGLMMLPICLVVEGFCYLFIKIIRKITEKNQKKVVIKGYKILFYLYVSEKCSKLEDDVQVKLIELAKNSEKHKKMFKYYIEKKEFAFIFGTCLCSKAFNLLISQPYEELYKEYKETLHRKKEKEKEEAKKILMWLFDGITCLNYLFGLCITVQTDFFTIEKTIYKSILDDKIFNFTNFGMGICSYILIISESVNFYGQKMMLVYLTFLVNNL